MKAFLTTFFISALLLSATESFGQARNYTTQQASLPCLNKTFSVVVHIIRDTFGSLNINTNKISNRISDLNDAFDPICVNFEVCETRIIDNFQYDFIESSDELEELFTKYHVPNRINLFVALSSALEFPQECGTATFNGIQEVETGGILMNKLGCFENGVKAMQHLFGHYFGLLHTFEGNGVENVDGSNCASAGDLICDTPADPYTPPADLYQGGYLDRIAECRFIHESKDANNEFYRPDVGNYMSYYPDQCRCGFTHDQYVKMAENYRSGSPKMW